MKLQSSKIIRDNKKLIIDVDMSEYYLQRLMSELENIDTYDITIKANKESRSVKQNNMLWAIIEKISLEVNGSKRDEDIWNVYIDLLHRANCKYDIVAAELKVLPTLEQHFRYVEKLPNSMVTEKGRTLYAFKCYIGSSKFDTKEMTEFIAVALDYASQVGVVDSEILAIEKEYL